MNFAMAIFPRQWMQLWFKKVSMIGSADFEPNLSKMQGLLHGISAETEAQVLKVSRLLRDLQKSYRINADLSFKLQKQLETEDAFSPQALETLKEELKKEIFVGLKDLSEGFEDLRKMQIRVNQICRWQDRIEQHSNLILNISTVMNIESSKQRAVDFDPMVEELKRLANQASIHIQELSRVVERINQTIGSFRAMAQQEADEMEAGVLRPFKEWNPVLRQLAFTGKVLGECCRRIDGSTALLTPKINEVIQALQYHDITQQQLDHIQDSFALKPLEGAPLAGLDIQGPGDEWLPLLFQINLHQLNRVEIQGNNMFETVHEKIQEILTQAGVQESSSSQALQVRKESLEVAGYLEKEFDSLLQYLSNSHDLMENLLEVTAKTKQEMQQMIKKILDVERIREDLELLSLNSMLQTKNMQGQQGSLKIISSAIRELSAEMESLFLQEREEIEKVSQLIEDRSNRLQESLRQRVKIIAAKREKAQKEIQTLVKTQEEILKSMSQVAQTSIRLSLESQSLLSKLDFNQTLLRGTAGVKEEMQRLLTRRTPPLGLKPQFRPQLRERLKYLYGTYTTAQERTTLKESLATLGGAEIADLLVKEFEASRGPGAGGSAQGQPHELDDDVLLF